jgi:hypothetical protein
MFGRHLGEEISIGTPFLERMSAACAPNDIFACMYHLTNLSALLVKDQLSPTCTLLAGAREFFSYFLQTTIINGDKSYSKILHLHLG